MASTILFLNDLDINETKALLTGQNLAPAIAEVKDIWQVNGEIKKVFTTWTLGYIGTVLCTLGALGNVVNIIVFCKMGYKETMNISFLGLAMADIGCLVTQLWLNIMYIPAFRDLGRWLLPFDPAEPTFRNLTAAWPHICFSRITGLVTAYATLVRCLCIAMPLKVKTILTPGRSLCIIVFIFVSILVVVSPVWATTTLGWTFSSRRNRTLYGQTSVDVQVEQLTYGLTNVCGYVSFFVVILCTAILIMNLRRKVKWRKTVTSAGSHANSDVGDGSKSTDTHSCKETKVIKIVVFISTIFIASYFPTTVVFLVATASPAFSPTGKYKNLFYMACSLTYNMEAVNSSVNIFIYLNMSSKYRATFDSIFCKAKKSEGSEPPD